MAVGSLAGAAVALTLGGLLVLPAALPPGPGEPDGPGDGQAEIAAEFEQEGIDVGAQRTSGGGEGPERPGSPRSGPPRSGSPSPVSPAPGSAAVPPHQPSPPRDSAAPDCPEEAGVAGRSEDGLCLEAMRACAGVGDRGLCLAPQPDQAGRPGDAGSGRPLVTESDLRRLPLGPADARVLTSPTGRVLLGTPTVVHAETEPAVFGLTLLGEPVAVRAAPVQYAWDFGDGSGPLVTTDPGRPWPDHTLSHAYDAPGRYEVVLATTWAGEYSVAGGPWTPIAGSATVTGPAVAVTVAPARSLLVG